MGHCHESGDDIQHSLRYSSQTSVCRYGSLNGIFVECATIYFNRFDCETIAAAITATVKFHLK